MKYQKLKTSLLTTLAFVAMSSSVLFANVDDRIVEKTREAVENASPHDWYTLALSAEKCFKKNVNLKEASEWLDKSLEIAQAPFNLELKGDYYLDNKLPEKALEYYLLAMSALKENDGTADLSKIQKKVAKIVF